VSRPLLLDLCVSERHYLSHSLPIWFALNPSERGTVWLGGRLADDPAWATGEGVSSLRAGYPPPSDRLTLVASFKDYQAVRGPSVYLEHGAGQRYVLGDGSRDPSYAGSGDHDRVRLFLAPREEVCDWWRQVYPDVPAVAVGCPKLDWLHANGRPEPTETAVAVSFHSESRLLPETYGAWGHFDPGLEAFVAAMRANGVTVLGHGHPRLWRRISARWEQLGVEPVENFDDVLRRASCYVCDNSSSLPEAAAVGIPLVWLNAPWWRRELEHGGRFWEWPRGQVECDHPDGLADAVLRALEDPPEVRAAREAMVASVYAFTDGRATERAVAAIRGATVECIAR
jgi:hypothetical protein